MDDRENNRIIATTLFEFSEWGRRLGRLYRQFTYEPRLLQQFLSVPPAQPARRFPFLLRYPLDLRQIVLVHGAIPRRSEENYQVDCLWLETQTTVRRPRRNLVKLEYHYQHRQNILPPENTTEFLKEFRQATAHFGCNLRVYQGIAWLNTLGAALNPRNWRNKEKPPKFFPPADWSSPIFAPPEPLRKLWRFFPKRSGPLLRVSLILLFFVCRGIFVYQKNASHDSAPAPFSTSTDPASSTPADPLRDTLTATRADFARVRRAIEQHHPYEAIALARSFRSAHPEEPKILLLLGRAFLLLGKLENARDAFQRMAQLKPDNLDAWLALSAIHLDLADPSAGQSDARRALRLAPTNGEALRLLVEASARLGRPADSQPALDAALRQAPGAVAVQYAHAMLLHQLGKTSEALAEINRSIQFNPPNGMLLAFRAILLQSESPD